MGDSSKNKYYNLLYLLNNVNDEMLNMDLQKISKA